MSDKFRNVMDKIQDKEVTLRNASGKLSRKLNEMGDLKESIKNVQTRAGMKHEAYEGKVIGTSTESKAKVVGIGGGKI